jgi:hypothetical protein
MHAMSKNFHTTMETTDLDFGPQYHFPTPHRAGNLRSQDPNRCRRYRSSDATPDQDRAVHLEFDSSTRPCQSLFRIRHRTSMTTRKTMGRWIPNEFLLSSSRVARKFWRTDQSPLLPPALIPIRLGLFQHGLDLGGLGSSVLVEEVEPGSIPREISSVPGYQVGMTGPLAFEVCNIIISLATWRSLARLY